MCCCFFLDAIPDHIKMPKFNSSPLGVVLNSDGEQYMGLNKSDNVIDAG